jgi:tetratricopeptide (TPR) repeat protein
MKVPLLPLCCALLLCTPARANADAQQDLELRVQAMQRDLTRRGEPPGEVSLNLAWLYARANRPQETLHYVREARKQGIAAGRLDLLLGTFYRQQARYDASFSTLVRVLVRHPGQPYALVQLWKTLYESKLQGAEVQTDTDAIRERLAGLGLHFPRQFEPDKMSQNRSKEIAAAGYNALLTGKKQFAAELFEAAIDAFPSNALAHRGLGIARARLQDYARAAGAYLLYLELKPDAPDADDVDRVLMEYWRHSTKVIE